MTERNRSPQEPWDLSDPVNPQPLIWPECTVCGNAFVYRWCMSLAGGGSKFAWVADCSGKKHKAEAKLVTHHGDYVPVPRPQDDEGPVPTGEEATAL